MIYKTFQKVSNVCQLLDKSKYPATHTGSGVTFTSNGDGSITVNGTATNEVYYAIKSFGDSLYLSHKYLLTGETSGLYLFVENRNENNGILAQLVHNNIRSLPSGTKRSTCVCYIKNGVVCDNLVLKPQLFDLTEMYGAGHEPTTVEEFRQDFPEEMYDYSPYCFVKSYKTLLKASNVCQLLDKSKYPATGTMNGITFTNNGDGTITANGTATYVINLIILEGFPIKKNHKYLILDCTGSTSRTNYSTWLKSKLGAIVCDSADKPIGNLTYNDDKCIVFVRVENGITVSNLTFKPQLFDLTEMYGAGNEPTTVEEFRQDFPEKLYDYKPYSIIPSYKKSLVCKTKNLFDINSVTEVRHIRSGLLKPTTRWSIKNNSFITTLNNYNDGVCYILPTLSLEPGIYTFSAFCTSDDELCWFGIYDFTKSEGFDEIYTANKQLSKTFEITEKSEIGLIMHGYSKNFIGTFSNIQLELGNTATDYVPYGHL